MSYILIGVVNSKDTKMLVKTLTYLFKRGKHWNQHVRENLKWHNKVVIDFFCRKNKLVKFTKKQRRVERDLSEDF